MSKDNLGQYKYGDNDYERFVGSDYHHVIFNLSLQEGWDDPYCYFAYIDKDMGSKDQVTQVVGRVLRQPDAKHYPYMELNTAHFYIRTDEKQVIEDVITEVKEKIAVDTPEVVLTIYSGHSGGKNRFKTAPQYDVQLPFTSIDATNALSPIGEVVKKIPDFRNDLDNTVGKGSRIRVLQNIGSSKQPKEQWIETDHTCKITARWLFKRELQKYFPKVANLCDTENPIFDAMIEYSSIAAEVIREKAINVVDAYVEHSLVVQDAANTFSVPEIFINPENAHTFKYSVHQQYSDFNQFELDFAIELDNTKKKWFRNPKQGCFQIPLLDKGDTNNFNPDFIVWSAKKIIAIDTKGDHLIVGDAARKLFTITKYGKGLDLVIRLVTSGEWTNDIKKIGKSGYTVWETKNGKIVGHFVSSLKDCVLQCLKI